MHFCTYQFFRLGSPLVVAQLVRRFVCKSLWPPPAVVVRDASPYNLVLNSNLGKNFSSPWEPCSLTLGLLPPPHPRATPSPEGLGPIPLSWVKKKKGSRQIWFGFSVFFLFTKLWLLRVTNSNSLLECLLLIFKEGISMPQFFLDESSFCSFHNDMMKISYSNKIKGQSHFMPDWYVGFWSV